MNNNVCRVLQNGDFSENIFVDWLNWSLIFSEEVWVFPRLIMTSNVTPVQKKEHLYPVLGA